jgi:hypothetical protein
MMFQIAKKFSQLMIGALAFFSVFTSATFAQSRGAASIPEYIEVRNLSGNPTDEDQVRIPIIFSEDFGLSFDASDVALSGSLAAGASIAVRAGDPDNPTSRVLVLVEVTFADPNANGDITINLGNGYQDLDGNPGVETDSVGPITIDNTHIDNVLGNPSFEIPNTGATGPLGWEIVDFSPLTPGERIWITGAGDARDGTSYIRNRQTQPTPPDFEGWEATEGVWQFEQNTTYRLRFNYRRHGFVQGRVILRTNGSVVTGPMTALETFFENVLHGDFPIFLADFEDEWIDRTAEFTIGPNGVFANMQRDLVIRGGSSSPDTWVDYDNFRIEIIDRNLAPSQFISTTLTGLPYDFGNGVIITYETLDTGQSHTVEKFETAAPEFNFGITPDSYWNIGELTGNFSATVSFCYDESELASAGLNETALAVYRRPTGGGSAWELVPSTTDTDANKVTINEPVTSFSDWTLAEGTPASAQAWQEFE